MTPLFCLQAAAARRGRSFIAKVCLLLAAALAACCPSLAGASQQANLLVNSSLESRSGHGAPAGWTASPPGTRIKTFTEDGASVFTLDTGSGSASALTQVIPLRPEWARLLIRGALRITQVPRPVKGSSQEPGAAIRIAWRLKAGGQIEWDPQPLHADPADGWVSVNRLLDIPPGADQILIEPMISGSGGSADFRNLSVVAWVKTFDDEFDGSAVDGSRWVVSDSNNLLYEPGEQYFAPDHLIIKDGIARFHADNTPHRANGPRPPLDGNFANTLYGDYRYQSAEIRSIGKFQQAYGCWEFRMKIPVVVGTWPAAYLLGWDEGWPPEIDVEESSGNLMRTVLQTNVYADDYGRMQRSWASFPSDGLDRSQWRTYAICWEPDEISWYIDGVYRGSTTMRDGRITSIPMYIRLNLAIGTFGGDPTRSPWPQDMDCDYVRVYQRSDLSLPLFPENSQEISLPAKTVALSAISCNPMSGFTARWTLAEGPAAVKIRDPHALVTTATVAKPGMYRFNLRVSRGAMASSRDVLVYVNAAK